VRPGADTPFGAETSLLRWGSGWDSWYAVAHDGRFLVSTPVGRLEVSSARPGAIIAAGGISDIATIGSMDRRLSC
jgi:hypothetical protein